MRKINLLFAFLLICTLMLSSCVTSSSDDDISPAQTPLTSPSSAPEPSASKPIFEVPDNISLMGLSLYMKLDEVVAILGEPDSYDEEYAGAFGANTLTYYYDFGSLYFIPEFYGGSEYHWVCSISIENPGYDTYKGINIGDSMNDAIYKLGLSKELIENKETVILSEGETVVYVDHENENENLVRLTLYFGEQYEEQFWVVFEDETVTNYGLYVHPN